jgi:hypothetical protein
MSSGRWKIRPTGTLVFVLKSETTTPPAEGRPNSFDEVLGRGQ